MKNSKKYKVECLFNRSFFANHSHLQADSSVSIRACQADLANKASNHAKARMKFSVGQDHVLLLTRYIFKDREGNHYPAHPIII